MLNLPKTDIQKTFTVIAGRQYLLKNIIKTVDVSPTNLQTDNAELDESWTTHSGGLSIL